MEFALENLRSLEMKEPPCRVPNKNLLDTLRNNESETFPIYNDVLTQLKMEQ